MLARCARSLRQFSSTTVQTPKVIVTCAVTGSGDSVDVKNPTAKGKSPKVPYTPEDIAAAAVGAAKAGASIVHCHVRDPVTGAPGRSVEQYAEVSRLIRSSGTDCILNLTAGMGGDYIPDEEDPSNKVLPGTDLVGVSERIEHVRLIKPDICSFDCGSMNYFASAYIATPSMLRLQAKAVMELGVKVEIECFELGHIWFAKQLQKEGLIPGPMYAQLCMGVPWAAEPNLESLLALRANLPPGAVWSSFAISRHQMPWVAASVLAGGHIRIGLEDNLFHSKGVYATNEELVENACDLIRRLGSQVATPDEAREILGLKK